MSDERTRWAEAITRLHEAERQRTPEEQAERERSRLAKQAAAEKAIARILASRN